MVPRSSVYVAFDIGGTLIDCDPRYLYDGLFGDKQELDYFLRDICSVEWNRYQNSGVSTVHAVANLCKSFPNYASYIRLYYDRFDDMVAGPMEGMESLVQDLLDRHIPLYALSNWPRETFPIALARFPLLQQFSGTMLSSEIGMLKPDPEFFECAFARFELNREAGIYVDDHPPNVAAAVSLGLQGVVFSTATLLRQQFAAASVL